MTTCQRAIYLRIGALCCRFRLENRISGRRPMLGHEGSPWSAAHLQGYLPTTKPGSVRRPAREIKAGNKSRAIRLKAPHHVS